MSSDSVRTRLNKLLELFTPHPGSITDETTMDQLGLDSLDRVELSYLIEDDFLIFFDHDYRIDGDTPVSKLIADILEHGNESH